MQFNDCTTNTANGFRPSRNLSATQTRHSGFKKPSNNWKPYWIFFQKSNCREVLGEIDVLTSEYLVASLRLSPELPAVLGGSLAAAPGARIACHVEEVRAPGSNTARAEHCRHSYANLFVATMKGGIITSMPHD
jgi:hypothetical protein